MWLLLLVGPEQLTLELDKYETGWDLEKMLTLRQIVPWILPEHHPPLVDTVELQFKTRQNISKTEVVMILQDMPFTILSPDHQLEDMVEKPGT